MSVEPLAALRRRLRGALAAYPALLASLGLVDRARGERVLELAVPPMVTGFLRTALRTSDFFLVSIALGDAAVAALELGFQYYFLGFALIIGLSSGTISVVSRFVGAGEQADADFAVTQSLWLALLISVPLTAATWLFAPELVGFLTDDPETVELGATYLRVVMLSLPFRYWSMVALRALQGAGDTRTPMFVRLVTLPTNIVLSAALIFGVGPLPALGIAGAAWGMALANTVASGIFLAVMLSGRFPVRLALDGRWWDWTIARELVTVGSPVTARRLVITGGRFPFLFVLATLGTPLLAAYAIGRRAVMLAMTPGGGYATASSTLVGQHLGAGEEEEAETFGWQVLRISLVTQVGIAVGLLALAEPIVRAFGTEAVGPATAFLYVFGVGVVGISVTQTMSGALRAAGDTSWPLYGTVLGTALRIGIAFLALPAGTVLFAGGGWTLAVGAGLGLPGVFAAILLDIYCRSGVTLFRYVTGAWKRVARRSAVGTGA